ncbi:MAG: glycosyltransferase family 39 protein, partial [Lachnospiraceae bacterium]|nr:glycosyltransferase family 39 protein [Lachnospiraceae bacterium]
MNLLKKDLERNNERKVMFGICFIFIIAMLIGSAYTSPLYPTNYGYDSAIFMLIGKAMVNGKTVYVDMFDHKGPILYFIEALGYYLGGRTGIWILQCIFGLVTIFFTYATWKLIYNKQQGLRMNDWLVVLVSGYSIFFYTFASGNLSEEYSLPFIAGCIYGFVKYVIRIEKEIKHSWIYAVFYGASIAILVLIRMNNAVAVCAGVLVIAVYLIYKKEYKNLLYNILGGMLGCSLILVPVIIYFLSKNALDDMIYATF